MEGITTHLRPLVVALLGMAAVLAFRLVLTSAATPTPVPLNSNAATDLGDDREPVVAADGAGNWVAVWHSDESLDGIIGTDSDILVARSSDNGATWTTPAVLNTNASSDSRDDAQPEVTSDGAGMWVTVWASAENLDGAIGTDHDILVARSEDNGATWTTPAVLNTNAGSDSGGDSYPQVITDGVGNWVAVWNSAEANVGGGIGTDLDILVSRSTDNGATWAAPTAIDANASSDTAHDDLPRVATDSAGTLVVIWETLREFGDILVARSTDGGVTWTAPIELTSDAASDSEFPIDWIPDVATDRAGNWVAVWYSLDDLGGTLVPGWNILVATSADNGATWTAPAAITSDPAPDHVTPRVATDGAGNWITIWESSAGVRDSVILVARSTDNGATWAAPTTLYTDPGIPTRSFPVPVLPRLTTDRAGNWVTVWMSDDRFGESIGEDLDILYTNCSPLDDDCDGWTTAEENLIGTDALNPCTPGGYPPDPAPVPNGNGVVQIDDVTFAASAFGSTTTPRAEIASQNGNVQIDDVTAFASRFGQTC